MARIDVSLHKKNILVRTDPAAVMQGDPIVWCFRVDDPAVAGVRLTFPSTAPFLAPNNPPHEFTRWFKSGDFIFGRAPIYFSPRDPVQVRNDKYTITFIDAAGNKVEEMDPDIRTNGP